MGLVYNIGIYEKGEYTSVSHLKAYKIWKGILQRCYSEKSLKKYPTYKGCEVCDEWKEFQNFAEWFSENYIQGYTIDKDILGDGKLYSSETCCFVPNRINNIFHKNKHLTNKFGQGVTLQGSRYRVQVNTLGTKRKHIGYYATIEEAGKAYKEAKIKATNEILDYYNLSNQITESIKEKIL